MPRVNTKEGKEVVIGGLEKESSPCAICNSIRLEYRLYTLVCTGHNSEQLPVAIRIDFYLYEYGLVWIWQVRREPAVVNPMLRCGLTFRDNRHASQLLHTLITSASYASTTYCMQVHNT